MTPRSTVASVVLCATVAALCAMLTACAAVGPPEATTRPSKVAQAQATHEYPSPTPPTETAAGAPTAVRAITWFADEYINWSADTIAAHMRALAAHSIGQARSAMELAAAQTAHDYELQRGGIANSGTVEAVAPLAGHQNEYVVVTRELTSATNTTEYEGLRPAWHLALATVVPLGARRWALSGWQPEG